MYDDHADGIFGATPVAVGESVSGVADYEYDLDFFVFEAEQGESYQIEVIPGTLGDPIAALYDEDWTELTYNDDSEDSLAPLIAWETPDSGRYFVEVSGYGGETGSYTLAVSAVGPEGSGDPLAMPGEGV